MTFYTAGEYVKIFHMKITQKYLDELHDAAMNPEHVSEEFLRVYSTKWFDLKEASGRLDVARHVAALASWADSLATGAPAS